MITSPAPRRIATFATFTCTGTGLAWLGFYLFRIAVLAPWCSDAVICSADNQERAPPTWHRATMCAWLARDRRAGPPEGAGPPLVHAPIFDDDPNMINRGNTRVALRKELIRQKIAEKYGADSILADMIGVNRTTLWRWLGPSDTSFPRDDAMFLKLAAAIDVDPFFLWDYTVENFADHCALVMTMHVSGQWDKLIPALGFLRPFLQSGATWPPEELARLYSERRWTVRDFRHDPTLGPKNYYSALVIGTITTNPQVWHFAFRDTGVMRNIAPWRPYGFVALWNGQLYLFNYNARSMVVPVPAETSQVVVETFFGEGPAEFRVASIHPFSLDVRAQAPVRLATVRFEP